MIYGPGGVLFLARWPNNELGQTKPGSVITDKIVNLAALGVTSSPGAILFTPQGQPGGGSFKISGYSDGQWYDADVAPDGAGTYDVVNLRALPGLVLAGGPEGIAYVPSGSPQFGAPSLLVSEYRAGNVATYRVDAEGDPILSTRRAVIAGLSGAEGALVDPVTGDFIFSTFGGAGRIIVVRGFRAPPPELPPPVAGESVNAFTARGTVRVRRPGGRFATLGPGQQIPVGSTVDTLKGRVTLVAAGDQTATFYDGVFKLAQGKGAEPLTTVSLVEKLRCGRARQGGRRREEEEAPAVGRRERQVPHEGQAQRGDGGRHAVAGRGPLHVDADARRARPGVGARLREEEDGDRAGGQEVRRARRGLTERLLTGA